jgi:hypothetical protein
MPATVAAFDPAMDDRRGSGVWGRVPTYVKVVAGVLVAAIAGLGVYVIGFSDGRPAAPPSGVAAGGKVASTTTPAPKATATTSSAPPSKRGPQTSEHYAPNGNFSGSTYLPGADGFNLADVSSNSATAALPPGVEGLVYLGTCAGATTSFKAMIASFVGDPKVFGFYLVDEPHIETCPPAHLKAESDWIHDSDPGTKTFIVILNVSSSPATPNYSDTYNPANTDVDLFGVTAYPCQITVRGCAYSWISRAVKAVERAGVPLDDIVPVYQAFGTGPWVLPTAAQESKMLSVWGSLVPAPVFDYAYSWGVQPRFGGRTLEGSPSLRSVFLAHNSQTN